MIVKVIETESRLVVASTWGEEEMGRYGSKAPTQEDEKFLVVDGAAGPGTREAPGNPAGWSVRIMRVSVTRQKRQGQL